MDPASHGLDDGAGMLDLNDFYYFVQVVDRGGFTAASRTLRIPKSTLSHRIQELEAGLGVRLLHRTSRRFGMFGQMSWREPYLDRDFKACSTVRSTFKRAKHLSSPSTRVQGAKSVLVLSTMSQAAAW